MTLNQFFITLKNPIAFCYFLLLVTCFAEQKAWGQKESNNWYFGSNAGLNFNTTPPTAITTGALYTQEGCASISDANGNLLFYTNGITVWNKNNQIMNNGTGLHGDSRSTQSALIVKLPGSSTLYYIFTVPDQAAGGAYKYSIADMSYNGGLGQIISKNQLLSTFAPTEALTANYHSNQKDIWVIVHEYNSTKYYSYLLTASGLRNPVISNAGSLYEYFGQVRISPDGKRIAASSYWAKGVELYDFNSSTGIISNARILIPAANTDESRDYGLSFSPNSNVLYITDANASIYQFDLSKSTLAEILQSKFYVGYGSGRKYPQLQLGSDKRIYMAQDNKPYLGVIKQPDVVGAGCVFVDNGISLNIRSSQLGLPTFMVNYVSLPSLICDLGNDTTLCPDKSIVLDAKNTGSTYLWNTNEQTQKITVTRPGKYYVDVTNSPYNTTSDTIVVSYFSVAPITLPHQYTFCPATDPAITLAPIFTETTYHWQDGSTNPTYSVTKEGLYFLQRLDQHGCFANDIFLVNSACFNDAIIAVADTALCASASIELDAGSHPGFYTIRWSTGENTQKIIVTTAGKYYVDIIPTSGNDYRTESDTVNVTYTSFAPLQIPSSYAFCPDDNAPILLNPSFSETVYHWQDGSTTLPYAIKQTGTYVLKRFNQNCSTEDTFLVSNNCKMIIPDLITPNQDGKNETFFIKYLPIPDWNIEIYNRWGELIYKTEKGYQNDWGSEHVSDGVYYYQLTNRYSSETYKGWVEVLGATK